MTSAREGGIAVGIDVGGTTVKLGLVAAGEVRARRRIPYARLASFDELVDEIVAGVGAMEVETGARTDALGIAAPGHARPDDGTMVDGTANVPLLRGRSLAAALRARTGLHTATVNDGSAATLGELHCGAGRGVARFALLTLGTGVGGGIAIDGRLVTGPEGIPPELGAMVLDDAAAGPRTLEDFASAAGFSAAYRRAGGCGSPAPVELFVKAAEGEAPAAAAIAAVGRRIAQGFGTLINALNLEACIVGGGIAQAGEPLIECIRGQLPHFTWPYLLARARVFRAKTDQDAGILGASLLASGQLRARSNAGPDSGRTSMKDPS